MIEVPMVKKPPKSTRCKSLALKNPHLKNKKVYISIVTDIFKHFFYSPVGWDCRIRRQHLCRGIRVHFQCVPIGYDTKLQLIVRLQSWRFQECWEPLSDPFWFGWSAGWLSFMAYQSLLVILYQILFIHTWIFIYMTCKRKFCW